MGRFIEELIVENKTYQTSERVLEGWKRHFRDFAKISDYQNRLEVEEDET